MSNQRYTPEFKEEAERLGVSTHSLYKWVQAVRPPGSGVPVPGKKGRFECIDIEGDKQVLGAVSRPPLVRIPAIGLSSAGSTSGKQL